MSVFIKRISVGQAAKLAKVSTDTVARWCRDYGIGTRLGPNTPWRVCPLGLLIVMQADRVALDAYQAERFDDPNLLRYIGEVPHTRFDEFCQAINAGAQSASGGGS